ncbi:rRNA maturation RNase YbeY [Candidatus Giovannonibacteria bacterium]|nr:rRNA maturation RNase YbeY [Candidatus Giovannonibacteria bacterium]
MIEFRNLSKKRIRYAAFRELYNKIFSGKTKFEVSVVFTGSAMMRSLNKRFRKKNKAANVLAFTLEEGKRGEIFLNAGEKELLFLFLHSSLHLLGYDHEKPAEAKRMEKEEKKLIKRTV